MTCVVCTHAQRTEIEQALLNVSADNKTVTIESIAREFEVSTNDLKLHALMHSPSGVTESNFDADMPVDSIARRIKLREADLLLAVANEYMVTLKSVGRRINALAQGPTDSVAFEKLMTKAIADLYIGVGGEIRATVKTMAELNQLLNGPETGSSGLQALAEAIAASKRGV